jgi:hypothetical protein
MATAAPITYKTAANVLYEPWFWMSEAKESTRSA